MVDGADLDCSTGALTGTAAHGEEPRAAGGSCVPGLSSYSLLTVATNTAACVRRCSPSLLRMLET